jgi:hypothetical protein
MHGQLYGYSPVVRSIARAPAAFAAAPTLVPTPTRLCDAGDIRYETACGFGSCNSGDREIDATCDGCGITCMTRPMAAGTKEICCRKPTPSPTEAPNNISTSAPTSAPPSAPATGKSSHCALPPPQQAFTVTARQVEVAAACACAPMYVLLGDVPATVWPEGESMHGYYMDTRRLCPL